MLMEFVLLLLIALLGGMGAMHEYMITGSVSMYLLFLVMVIVVSCCVIRETWNWLKE